jgi:pimeloyl-ACP methyl ester carboxylesterase
MSEPLILVPGLLCDRALWAHPLAHLGPPEAMSVPDLRPHEGFEAMAEAILAEAPPRFALAGLSMGGYVAHAIMRLAPERVSRLALLDTSARADTPEQTTRRRALIELAKIGKFKGVTPRLLPLLVHKDRLADTALTDTIMGMAERIGQEAFLRHQTAIIGRIDSRPHLAAYACPTLVMVGRQDAITPVEVSAEQARMIPGAKLVVIEGCGHLTTLERPEAATAVLSYWLQN